MFDIGFWEFALISVIILIVVGPERMPKIAKKAGQFAGKIKRFIAKIQDDFAEELESDKLKAHLNIEDKNNDIVEILEETKSTLKDIKLDSEKSK